jgi:predicted amidophosphoribosyltransferase
MPNECTPWKSTRFSRRHIANPHGIESRLTERIISLLAPPYCSACGRGCAAGALLCGSCEEGLAMAPRVIEPGPVGVELAVAASPFDGPARSVVHALKYARRLALAEPAAAAMLRALPVREGLDGVVPVPAGPWRWRWRGFDPAEEIAHALAARAGIPVVDCLRRRSGRRQVGRRRSERLANPPRVWAAGPCPREALLVDDVWTTGATLSACAHALRQGGTRRIVALTLARTL